MSALVVHGTLDLLEREEELSALDAALARVTAATALMFSVCCDGAEALCARALGDAATGSRRASCA
jgi:hypothetical protein